MSIYVNIKRYTRVMIEFTDVQQLLN